MRTVIVVGCHSPWDAPKPADTEIWCINRSFRTQPGCDRVYMMDDLEAFWSTPERKARFLADVNGASCRVILREKRTEVPRSERFDIEGLLSRLPFQFFICTASYMVAQAIREQFDRIVMHRIYVLPQSTEYFEQLPCLNFWLALAIGMGIRVELSEDSDLCRAFPWQSGLYGYQKEIKPTPMSVELSLAVEKHMKDTVTIGAPSPDILDAVNQAAGIMRYSVPRPIDWRAQPSFTGPLGAPPDVMTAPVIGGVR